MLILAIIYSLMLIGLSKNESLFIQFILLSVMVSFATMNPLPVIAHGVIFLKRKLTGN